MSKPSQANPEERLAAKIVRIAALQKDYGYRRVTAELGRQGQKVGAKKVLRVMREQNVLVRRKRRYVRTTDSLHGRPVYVNLKPFIALFRVNQMWVADMTYIRLPGGFCYLAVVLDAYSRKVVGWALSLSIDTQLVLSALRMAIAERGAPLYHHSDRGVQYASAEYVAELAMHQVQMSMSRRGNPYDNAGAESFMKTLKVEEVYVGDYSGIDDARANVGHFLEVVYNQERLHSSIGYVPPNEFEDNL
jgi:transposase InsO family protein